MPQHMGMGNQSDAGGQAGEGAAGVVGVDRRAPLGAEHQIQLDRLGRPAGFDPSKRDRLGLHAGKTQAGLLAAVLAQRLHGERWQGKNGAAGSGLDRPDRQFLAPAAVTWSSWRTWPKVKLRSQVPTVEAAITRWPSTAWVDPQRSNSTSSMQSAPATMPWTRVSSLRPGRAAPGRPPRSTS
jgi:hypothetical protein